MRVPARLGTHWTIALTIGFLALALGAPAAEADTADIIAPQNGNPPKSTDGWQAGTCKLDVPECSVDGLDQFFKKAAGHPPVGFTQFIVKQQPAPFPFPGEVPVGNLKTVRVDLPVGLSVNPQATPQPSCELAPGASPSTCPASTKVGTSAVTATNPATGFSLTLPAADVFNIVPENGEPARFGFSVAGNDVFLEAGVAWEGDYHEFFTIHVAQLALPGIPGLEVARIFKNRLVFNGRAGDGMPGGDGTFITTPSTCFNPATPPFEHVYSTYLRADSYEVPDAKFPDGSEFFESSLPGDTPIECANVNLDGSSVGVDPNTLQTDSPSGASVNVDVPHITGGGTIARSNVKTAKVTLPPGMGLNPSAATGLEACTDAQFGKGTRNPVACPDASKIGTVSIQTPPLPPDSLAGNVYLGKPLSSDPASGQEFRIFVDAESDRYGISARLIGQVSADPQTGQLTTTFAENPQVPFSSFQLNFNGGPQAPLSSPPICGPNQTTTALTPYSGTPDATPSSGFSLTSAPGGGSCPQTPAERPFAPGFGADTSTKTGGSFTGLTVDLSRPDGAQEVKGVNVDLPPGLVAKLAGVAYCPEQGIVAAAAMSGVAEQQSPSCPASSEIGFANVRAGTGQEPLSIQGRVYLAGPYKGAPLSLVFVTPAVAGPFDLGTVVVRVALFLDPNTTQVHAVSDPIPHVFGGVTLDLRSISVDVDRSGFTLNPTNCDPKSIGATLLGGGADPNNPAAFFPFQAASPFQAVNCDRLAFAPKLHLRLFGTQKDFRRNGHPRLRAVLVARGGDANVGRVAVTLPQSIQLDQSHIRTVCTRAQFAASACPPASVYGHATAFTPLLDQPLSGQVYLRSGDNALPDLAIALRGQVDVNLVGRTDTNKKGQLRNTFDAVPDVPVSKFILSLQHGKRGLLVPNSSLCGKHSGKATVKLRGQNGKTANGKAKLRIPCRHRRRGNTKKS